MPKWTSLICCLFSGSSVFFLGRVKLHRWRNEMLPPPREGVLGPPGQPRILCSAPEGRLSYLNNLHCKWSLSHSTSDKRMEVQETPSGSTISKDDEFNTEGGTWFAVTAFQSRSHGRPVTWLLNPNAADIRGLGGTGPGITTAHRARASLRCKASKRQPHAVAGFRRGRMINNVRKASPWKLGHIFYSRQCPIWEERELDPRKH